MTHNHSVDQGTDLTEQERRWIEEELVALESEELKLDSVAEAAIQRAVQRLRDELKASGRVTARRVRWTHHLLAWAKSNVEEYRALMTSGALVQKEAFRRGPRPADAAGENLGRIAAFDRDLAERGWAPFEVVPDEVSRRTTIRFAGSVYEPSRAWRFAVTLNGQAVPGAAVEAQDELEGTLVLDGLSSESCVIETEADAASGTLSIAVLDPQWRS